MTTKEIKERYDALYDYMKNSRDVRNMKLFGVASTNIFNKAAEIHPELAMAMLDMLSAMEYHNFVTPVEATEVAAHFVNEDTMVTGTPEPTKGPHWSMDVLKSFLAQRGLPLEEKPYYNWPALWLTVNMEYSDLANTFVELLGSKENERLAVASYKVALAKLRDLDRPHFVREYFELDD